MIFTPRKIDVIAPPGVRLISKQFPDRLEIVLFIAIPVRVTLNF